MDSGHSKKSFFQNLKTGDWIEGPEMLVPRLGHGCTKFKFEGRSIAIVAGGTRNIGRSVEWLDLGKDFGISLNCQDYSGATPCLDVYEFIDKQDILKLNQSLNTC